MTPSFEAVGLSKSFCKRKGLLGLRRAEPAEVLRGIDLVLQPGKLVALIGPNGAGKTTLLKIIAGLIEQTSGTLRFSTDVRIGYVLADTRSFYFRLTVRENLEFFAALCGLARDAVAPRIDELTALFGLSKQREARFADLSSGQQQRLALARGLLNDPEVVLVDEATRSLDPGRAARLRAVFRALVERQGKAVLFATHDLEEARAIADRVVLLVDGRIDAEGEFDQVKTRIQEVFDAEAAEDEAEFRAVMTRLEGASG